MAYASYRRRTGRRAPTLGQIARGVVARIRSNWKRTAIFAAMGFALSWIANAYVMGKKYDGYNSPSKTSPVTGKGSVVVGSIFWFLFTTVLFAIVGYRLKVGKERFWESVREFPQTLRGLVRDNPDKATVQALVGFASAIVVMLFVGPALTSLIAVGVLVFVASALRPLMTAIVSALWRQVLGKVLTTPPRQPGPDVIAVGSMGAVGAAVLSMAVDGRTARVFFAIVAVVAAIALARRQGSAAAMFLLFAGAAVLLLGEARAWADDGGISECGGIDNWAGCDGTGELAEQAVIGGIAGAGGAVVGEAIGEGLDEEGFDDGSGGEGGPDDDDGEGPPWDDGGSGMCDMPDDEELDDEASQWAKEHPGEDWDEFMAQKIAGSRSEAEAKQAELDRLGKDVQKLDDRLREMDENIRKPVKNFGEMTNKEKHDARTQMTRAWKHANPKGDPAQLTAMLNRMDVDPSLSPVDMMTYVLGETVLGLPGGIKRAADGAVNTITGGGKAGELLTNMAANYWDDVVSGKALENMDKFGATIVAGIGNASEYYGNTSAEQIIKDYKAVAKASGQTVSNVTVAQVQQAKKALAALEQAAITGDAPAIAKILDDAGGQLIFDYMTGAAAGKAVKVGSKGLQMLSTKADDVTAVLKVKMAPKTKLDITTAPHGTPIKTLDQARALGHTQDEIKAIQAISTDNDVIIRTRPGTPDRLTLLEQGGMGKPEHIKSKSITPADVKLGFRQEDVGKIGHLTDDMYARLKAMDPSDLPPDVAKRLQQRLTEHVDRVGDLKKLEKGMKLRVPDPDNPGKLKTTQFKAAPDEHGVMRTPDGTSFNGDLDIGDILHKDGRPFFVDHDGKPLTGAALRADRELMVKIQHELREKAGTLHGGGYWDPKPVVKKGKGGHSEVSCANIRVNEAISKEAGPGGKALVEFTPGGKDPTTAYGTGKPRKKYTGYKPWDAEKVDPVTGKKTKMGPPAKPKPGKPLDPAHPVGSPVPKPPAKPKPIPGKTTPPAKAPAKPPPAPKGGGKK